MYFWIIIGVLFIISFIWAFLSLRRELFKPKETKHAEEELKKEKILFKL